MRKNPPNKKMTDELEMEILEMYSSGLSAPRILDEVGLFKTSKTIYDILKKHGKVARTGESMRDPNLDHSYFQNVDTADKAYLLGLIVSDGWVTKPGTDNSGNITKSPQIAFSLTESDRGLVEWVAAQWKTQNKISIIEKDETIYPNGVVYVSRPMSRVIVSSQKMYSDLNRLGVDTKKSYLSILPILEKELYGHFLRGLFDGDGTVGVYPYGNSLSLSMKFNGTQCILGQIAWMLHSDFGMPYVKPSGHQNRVICTMGWDRTEDTKQLSNILYKDVDKSQCLQRKRKIVEDYFSQI